VTFFWKPLVVRSRTMRFAVATAILSHSSLHAASFEGKRSLGKFFSHARGENFEALLKKKPSPLGTRQQKRTSQHQRRVAALKKKLQGKLERPLKNRREAKEVVECDPNALDLGVLACGSDQFCVKNRSSSKGGVCSSRRLEDTEYEDDGIYYDDYFFNPYCEYYFDNATDTTTKACDYGYCSEDCCAEQSYTAVIGADGVVSVAYTTNFTEPYAQTGTLLLDETGCTVEIDGEICPCTFDTTFSTVDGTGFPCVAFECPSVLDGLTYDSCSPYNEGTWLPLLEYCASQYFDDEDPYFDYEDDDENYPDCTYDYDYETYTETRTCIYTACDEGGPCCYEFGHTSVLTPYAVESFTLFGNLTEPYAQTLSVTLESTGCTAVIGGETCLSCTFDGVFYGLCFSFDCSNVIEGHTYDSCSEGEFILPVLETCEVSEEDDEAPIESESPTESPEAPIEIPTESPTPLESPTEGPVTSAAHLKSAASLVGFAAALVLYFGT